MGGLIWPLLRGEQILLHPYIEVSDVSIYITKQLGLKTLHGAYALTLRNRINNMVCLVMCIAWGFSSLRCCTKLDIEMSPSLTTCMHLIVQHTIVYATMRTLEQRSCN